jgi:hypothetical protein
VGMVNSSSPILITGSVGDFRGVLDHLKADGYYLFEGELIEPLRLGKQHGRRRGSAERGP